MALQFVAVTTIVVVDNEILITHALAIIIVEHITASRGLQHAGLELEKEFVVVFIKLPTHATNVGSVNTHTRTIGHGLGLLASDIDYLNLIEITLATNLRARSAYIEAACALAVVQKQVGIPRSDGRARHIDRATEALVLELLGDNVDNTRIALGLIASRRGCDDLNILDCRGGNLLQSQRTLLAINIYQKARTSTERHSALIIHAHRRRHTQHIGCRTACRRERRIAADGLTVEFIDNLALLARNDYLLQSCLGHLQSDSTHIDGVAAREGNRVADIGLITYEHNGQHELAIAHAIDLELATAHRSRGNVVVFNISNYHIGKVDGCTRRGIHNATFHRRSCLCRKAHRRYYGKEQE